MPAVRSAPAEANEIWLMGANGEQARRLLTAGSDTNFRSLTWQPDGKRLGYMRWRSTSTDDFQSSIETCDLSDTEPSTILADPDGNIADFSYLRDGRIVYSRIRDYQTETDLWQISSDKITGKPVGAPVRLTNWPRVNVRNLSATADGRHLTFLVSTIQTHIYIGELTADGVHLKTDPHPITHEDAIDYPTAWTSDSSAVLFTSDSNGSWGLYKQEVDKADRELLVGGTRPSPASVQMENGFYLPARMLRPQISLRLPRNIFGECQHQEERQRWHCPPFGAFGRFAAPGQCACGGSPVLTKSTLTSSHSILSTARDVSLRLLPLQKRTQILIFRRTVV